MAIIKLGTLIVGIRGTVGGATFSQNGTSPYVKSWRKPSNPTSPAQLASRNVLASWPNAWRALTQANRDAWDVWAALPAQQKTNSLGEPYFIPGFQWYVSINTHAVQIGFTTLANPPNLTKPSPPPMLTATVQASPLEGNVTYAAGTFGATDSIVVYATSWKSQAALTAPKTFRYLRGTFNPPATSFEFKFQWNNILGTPIIGTKAFIHVYNQNSQRYRSEPTLITADVIA